MNRVETGGPDRLDYREASVGCRIWLVLYVILSLAGFGLPAAGAIFGERWSNTSDLFQTLGIIAVMSFGGVFILVLLTALFSMSTCLEVRIDRSARTVERRWGWLVPVGLGTVSLNRYQELRLCHEPRPRGGWEYRLYLANTAGERLLIGRAKELKSMGAMADGLGAFLGLRVVNGT